MLWMQFFRGAPTGNRAELAMDSLFMSDTAIDFNLTGWTGESLSEQGQSITCCLQSAALNITAAACLQV